MNAKLHKWLLIAFAAVALIIIVDAARAEGYVLVAGHVVNFEKNPTFLFPLTTYGDNQAECKLRKAFLEKALSALAGNNYAVLCYSESQLRSIAAEDGDPA